MRKTVLTITIYFLPTAVLSSVGILILVFQRAGFDIVFGVLVLIFSITVLSGGIVLQGTLSAQARRARLQTDFVAKVSHELRTPLASIRMFVDTLKAGGAESEEEAKMCLDVISTETSRLTSMIERLLSWGRMEAGRRVYDKRPELAATLVGEALAQLETQLKSSDVEVEVDIQDEPLGVLADRDAMDETLLNLLSNAGTSGAEEGQGAVTVRVRKGKSPKRVLIEVQDDGPGIPRKEQRQVFERFYRGTLALNAQVKGSGLGLAMARHVVRAHKGRIRLRSERDEGTRFTIDLPALPKGVSTMEVPPG